MPLRCRLTPARRFCGPRRDIPGRISAGSCAFQVAGLRALVRSISKRLLPNKRASIDHAPGPSIAALAESAARKMRAHLPSCLAECIDIAHHNSARAAKAPVTGVHKPSSRKIPPPAAIRDSTIAVAAGGFPERWEMPPQRRAIPRQTLSSSRPNPGQPFGNVEKSRCRTIPPEHKAFIAAVETPDWPRWRPPFGG